MVEPTGAFESLLKTLGLGAKEAEKVLPKPKPKSVKDILSEPPSMQAQPPVQFQPGGPTKLTVTPDVPQGTAPSGPAMGQAPPLYQSAQMGQPPIKDMDQLFAELKKLVETDVKPPAGPSGWTSTAPPKTPTFGETGQVPKTPTKPPANIWQMSDLDIKSKLKPGDPVQAGEGGAQGIFKGIGPSGTINIDWKAKPPAGGLPGASPSAAAPFAGAPKTIPPTKVPITQAGKLPPEATGEKFQKETLDWYAAMAWKDAKNTQEALDKWKNMGHWPSMPPAVQERIIGQIVKGKEAQPKLSDVTPPGQALTKQQGDAWVKAWEDTAIKPLKGTAEQRRIKGGYTTPAYRGGEFFHYQGSKVYLAANPDLAALYNSKTKKLWLRTQDYHVFNAKGKSWSDVSEQAKKEAKAQGAKGIIVHNVADEPDLGMSRLGPQTTYVVWDLNTMRQEGAAFDPAKMTEDIRAGSKDHLRNMLASGAAVALGGGIAGLTTSKSEAAPLPKTFHVSPKDFEKFAPLKEVLGSGESAMVHAEGGPAKPIRGPGTYSAEATGTRDYYVDYIKERNEGKAFVYELEKNVDSSEVWDLDKPVDQQPAAVKLALQKLNISDVDQYYKGGAELASALDKEGVKATKFLDAGSREAGKGTYNYITHNPENINILKKIPMSVVLGAGGAGVALAAGGTQARAAEGDRPSVQDILSGKAPAPTGKLDPPSVQDILSGKALSAPAQPTKSMQETMSRWGVGTPDEPQPVDTRLQRAWKALKEGIFEKPGEPSHIPEGKTEGSLGDFGSQWWSDSKDFALAGAKKVREGAEAAIAPFSHEKLVAYNKYEDDLKRWEAMSPLEREVVPKPQLPEGTGQAGILKGVLTGTFGAMEALASPASGLWRAGASRFLEKEYGVKPEVTEFIGNITMPGQVGGMFKLKQVFGTVPKAANFIGNQINKVFAPEKIGTGEAAGTLLRAGTGSAARFTETARDTFNHYWNAVDAMPDAHKLGLTAYIEGRTGGAVLHDPALQPVADAFRDQMAVRQQLLANSPITSQMSFVEDYYPHMGWEDPTAAKQFVQNWFTKQGFGKNIKQRIIPTVADGIAAGLKPITYNPLEMGMMYIQNMDRFIAHNNVFSAGRAAGHVKYALNHGTGGKKWNPAMDAKGWVPLEGRLSTKKTPAGEMVAYAPEEFARVYNNFIGGGFHGVKGPYGPMIGGAYDKLQHASNAITGMELGLSGFHLFNEVNEAMASAGALALSHITGAFGALKSGQVKEAGRLLAGSAGHLIETVTAPVTKAITGHKGQNIYLGRSPGTAQNRELIDLLEMGGGRAVGTHGQELEFRQTVGKSYLNAFRKLSDFIDKRAWQATGKSFKADYKAGKVFPAPVAFVARQVGRTLATFADPLFKTYIPKLKTGAFMDNMKAWIEANPTASYPEKVAMAQKIWNSIDNRMGEMVQDNVFWPNMLKQSAKLGLRSYSWTMGTIREVGGGAKTLVTHPSRLSIRGSDYDPKAGYVIAMPMMYFMTNAIYQYMKTGKPPENIDDVLHGRTGGVVPGLGGRGAVPERITMPSQMKDVFGWYEDWQREAYAKLSGMTQAGIEVLTNKDWKGDPIINPEGSAPSWAKDYFHYAERFLPISVRTEMQGEKRGSQITPTERRLGLRPAGSQWTDPEGLRKYKLYQSKQLEKKRRKQELRQRNVYGAPE